MSDEDWEALEKHFKERTLQVGSGIRMVLIQFLKEQGALK
jgi:hypothetical protein